MFKVGQKVECCYVTQYRPATIEAIHGNLYTVRFDKPVDFGTFYVDVISVYSGSLKPISFPASKLEFKEIGKVVDNEYWNGALICRTFDNFVLVKDYKHGAAFQSTWNLGADFKVVHYGYINVE